MDLSKFFELQKTFNERVGLDDEKFRAAFSFDEQAKTLTHKHHYEACLLEAGGWIDDMLKAINSEIEELRDHTYWKHWCEEAQNGRRYELKDVESARKEVIDILHFWISLCQILGMTPEIVAEMYTSKLAKNIKRQEDGYSIEVKDLAWKLFNRHDYVNPAITSLEDMLESEQVFWLAQAKAALENESDDGYSIEEKDCAWKLFRDENPKDHPQNPWPNAESLGDLPEDIAAYYLNWAKGAHLCDTCVHGENDCSMAVGKTWDCTRYHKKSDNHKKYESLSDIPDCSKCGCKCTAGYAMTGEGPVCGSCV